MRAEGTFIEARVAWLLKTCDPSCVRLQKRAAFLFHMAGLGADVKSVSAADLELDLNFGNDSTSGAGLGAEVKYVSAAGLKLDLNFGADSTSGACDVKHKRHLYLKT